MSLLELSSRRPFVIEHRRLDETPKGFVPDARLVVSPALRTSGLLAALSDEQARTLLALLTYLTPNGGIYVTAAEVAEALGVPRAHARRRLDRLAAFRLGDQAVVICLPREAGLPVYGLSHEQVENEQSLARPDISAESPTNRTRREAVTAYSRAR